MNGRTVVITALAATFIGTLYFLYAPSSASSSMSKPASTTNGIPGLEFRLSQISKNPPSLLVTLRNSSPDSTFTILKWGTPLDPQASNLGVFRLVDAETGDEIKTDIIKIGRKMPPSTDDLLEISPQTESAIEVIFDKPWMPQKKPAKYQVQAMGNFYAVWEKPANEVKESELAAYNNSPFHNRPFGTDETQLVVE